MMPKANSFGRYTRTFSFAIRFSNSEWTICSRSTPSARTSYLHESIESPVWHERRHAILRRGIEAYFANDPIVAVHILVVEIENAVRILAAGLGLALQKQNRMGGFDLKNLGDFLADETVAAFLTEDVVTYLRVVLTDRRGWNLRNDTCHGILPATSFTQAASQRLLHIVLLLSAVRTKAEAGV